MILQDFGHVGSVCVCGVPLRDSFNGIKQTLAWSKINGQNIDGIFGWNYGIFRFGNSYVLRALVLISKACFCAS
jgi:hypothetical protein